MHNASWVISNMAVTTQAQNAIIFCKFFKGIWINYVDIQDKSIQVRFTMPLCTREYNSPGDPTRQYKVGKK